MNKIISSIHLLFIPKKDNDFRAKALHIDFLTYYLIIAILFSFFVKNLGGPLSNILGYATDITVEKLLTLTNNERAKYSLASFNYNDKLADAANKKAHDMFTNNYWSHYGQTGTTPWDFILAAGYKYEYAGENLAKNFLFSDGVVSAWMNSPTHRENILRKEYSEVGFAVVNGILNGEETTLVVQMLGKPQGSLASLPSNTTTQTTVQEQKIIPTVPVTPSIISSYQTKPSVLAKNSKSNQLNFLTFTYNVNVVFIGFLLLALIMDFYFAAKFNIVKLGGKNFAHLIFISFILFGLLFFTKGTIL